MGKYGKTESAFYYDIFDSSTSGWSASLLKYKLSKEVLSST